MSVAVEDGVIRLSGRCLAEDAETLLVALQDHSGSVVDLSQAQKLHLAVVQVLLAAGARCRGTPENPFLADHVIKLLQ